MQPPEPGMDEPEVAGVPWIAGASADMQDRYAEMYEDFDVDSIYQQQLDEEK